MFSLVSLSKSKFFTLVAIVSFVSHSSHFFHFFHTFFTLFTLAFFVSHWCRSCHNVVALVLLLSHSCCLYLALVLQNRLDLSNNDRNILNKTNVKSTEFLFMALIRQVIKVSTLILDGKIDSLIIVAERFYVYPS